MAEESIEIVKAKIDQESAKKIVFDLYGLKVIKISELNGFDDKNFHVMVDEGVYDNIHINEVLSDGYLLKIVNSLESQDSKGFEAQTELLIFLNKNSIRCPKPIPTKDQKQFDMVSLSTGEHIVRLLEFIPGDILFKCPKPGEDVYYQVGVLAAKIDNALQNFDHPAYRKNIQWCLGAAPDILTYIHVIDENKQTLIKNIVSEFSSRVLSVEDGLAKGIIHGDVNEQNLIVGTIDKETVLKAVIDFGDTHYCCYLYELALAMTYMIFMSNNTDSGGHVLAGYSSIREVTKEEFSLLKICVMTRFCQSLVLGAYSNSLDPGNAYLLTTSEKGWELLEKLSSVAEEEQLNRWKKISEKN